MKKTKQMGLPSLIWMGFSFIAGITFTASFSTIVSSQENGVGNHLIWIYPIEGAVAFICAWAFAKLVKVHPKANGGTSQYARASFGKFMGLASGVLNYAYIPLITMTLIVSMIRTNFGNGSNINLVGDNGKWGDWGNLYLDLIAFGIFILATSIIFFGISKFKIVANSIGYITWTLTLVIMIIAITQFIKNGNSGLVLHNGESHLNYKTFSNAFTTSFFAFCGVETFIATGNNIKDREKNMPKAIVMIMILVTLFYIIFTLLILGAVTQSFGDNPNIQIFGNSIDKSYLFEVGGWLIIICTLFMRFNSILQITFFAGSTLEPMAKQYFISNKISKVNKHNVPVGGVIATIIIFVITSMLFLFLPDIIQGVTGDKSPFDYSQLAGTCAFFFLILYSIAIIVVLKNGFNKKMKVRIWEYIAFIVCMLFLMYNMIMYFIGIGSKIQEYINASDVDKKINSLVGVIIQLVYISIVIILILALYFGYHKPKLKKVLQNDELKKELLEYEKVFIINDPSLR